MITESPMLNTPANDRERIEQLRELLHDALYRNAKCTCGGVEPDEDAIEGQLELGAVE